MLKNDIWDIWYIWYTWKRSCPRVQVVRPVSWRPYHLEHDRRVLDVARVFVSLRPGWAAHESASFPILDSTHVSNVAHVSGSGQGIDPSQRYLRNNKLFEQIVYFKDKS